MAGLRFTAAGAFVLLVLLAAALTGTGLAQTTPETDHTVTRVDVHPNGSATWTVRIRTRLTTQDDVDNFEAFQERFRRNTSRYLDPFGSRIRGTVAEAANATGREMTATDFAASTSVQTLPRRWGVVTYRFRWTGFARAGEDRLVVGDVFQGGFFIAGNDSLVVSAPQGWAFESVSPVPAATENGTVRWQGRRDFPDNRPRVVLVPDSSGETDGIADSATAATSVGSSEDGGSGGGLPGVSGVVALAALVAVSVFVGLGAFVRRRARGRGESPNSTGTLEPMNEEQRVLELLERNDGQMRQADIVETVEWSKSKTSRVLSSMAEEGAVEKVRLGRENVIQLPDED